MEMVTDVKRRQVWGEVLRYEKSWQGRRGPYLLPPLSPDLKGGWLRFYYCASYAVYCFCWLNGLIWVAWAYIAAYGKYALIRIRDQSSLTTTTTTPTPMLDYSLEEIYSSHSSEKEKTHACSDVYVNCHPESSWEHLTSLLYREDEMTAVDQARPFLPPRGKFKQCFTAN